MTFWLAFRVVVAKVTLIVNYLYYKGVSQFVIQALAGAVWSCFVFIDFYYKM